MKSCARSLGAEVVMPSALHQLNIHVQSRRSEQHSSAATLCHAQILFTLSLHILLQGISTALKQRSPLFSTQRRTIFVCQQQKTSTHTVSPPERAINFCARLDECTKELLKNVTPEDTDRLVGRCDAPSKSLQHSMFAVCEIACEAPEEAAWDKTRKLPRP